MEEIDLGVSRAFLFPGTGAGSAVILPGAGYSVQAPLLWFARLALQAEGFNVLAVDDRFTRGDDALAWVVDRAAAALAHFAGAEPIVVGKSISTLATGLVAERRLPAIWLTPLLDYEIVGHGLQQASAPVLLVGGTADPSWDGSLARGLAGAQVLELAGADHALESPGDPLASLDNLRQVVEEVRQFVGRLEGSSGGQ